MSLKEARNLVQRLAGLRIKHYKHTIALPFLRDHIKSSVLHVTINTGGEDNYFSVLHIFMELVI